MAITLAHGAVSLQPNVFTTVYLCTAGKIVTGNLNIHNTSGATVTVRYYYGTNATAAGPTDARECVVLQPAGDPSNGCTAERTGITLDGGKIISCMANGAGVVAAFIGLEES